MLLDISVSGIMSKLTSNTPNLGDRDNFEAVQTPGDVFLLSSSWLDAATSRFGETVEGAEGARVRHVRAVREYRVFDQREVPQSCTDAEGRETKDA